MKCKNINNDINDKDVSPGDISVDMWRITVKGFGRQNLSIQIKIREIIILVKMRFFEI